jgi:hypothetical protein
MIRSRWKRWVEHVVCMGGKKIEYNILVKEPEGKQLL